MKIYILRHGETEWNKRKRLQGITNIPLDENGLRLAYLTGEAMKREGISFDACISSPLDRAVNTAGLVLAGRALVGKNAGMDLSGEGRRSGSPESAEKTCRIPFRTDIRIREVNLGPIEGKCLRDDPEFPPAGEQAHIFFDSPAEFRAQEGVESYQEIIARTGAFLDDLAKEYAAYEGRDLNILISTHGCAGRGLLMNIAPVPLEDYWRGRIPPNCSVSIAALTGGRWKLIEQDHVYAKLS